jgi:hypothetical protein
MGKVFNQLPLYGSLLEMVKVVVLNIDEKPYTYFLIPIDTKNILDYRNEISEKFSVVIPELKTIEGLNELELNLTYKFELIRGLDFDKKYIAV